MFIARRYKIIKRKRWPFTSFSMFSYVLCSKIQNHKTKVVGVHVFFNVPCSLLEDTKSQNESGGQSPRPYLLGRKILYLINGQEKRRKGKEYLSGSNVNIAGLQTMFQLWCVVHVQEVFPTVLKNRDENEKCSRTEQLSKRQGVKSQKVTTHGNVFQLLQAFEKVHRKVSRCRSSCKDSLHGK